MSKTIVIIGGGPGGYVAAIRAAQLGADVHLVEAEKLGGTCLNVGCIPTKALMHTAEIYQAVKKGSAYGINVSGAEIDWHAAMNNKQRVVNRLVKGVESLLKANNVTLHRGRASLVDAKTVAVAGDNRIELTAEAIILAVGSEPVTLRLPGAGLPGVIDSTGALKLANVPKSLVIVGGGVIGVEFAALYHALGTEVTVVEMLPEILPSVEQEIAAKLRQQLEKTGVEFMTGASLERIEQAGEGLTAFVKQNDTVRELTGEYVLIGVGRAPRTADLGLERLGVTMNRGRISVNDRFETSVPGVYAIGDCNGQSLLAHAASAQGAAAAENALGYEATYFGHIIPACIYTNPEIGSVGLTESEAARQGLAVKVGVFPLSANGKALIENGGIGMVKVIANEQGSKILGVHILGPRATELIAEAALAIRLEATLDQLISTIHAHPTVSEAMAEAAMAADGLAIHWPPGMKVR